MRKTTTCGVDNTAKLLHDLSLFNEIETLLGWLYRQSPKEIFVPGSMTNNILKIEFTSRCLPKIKNMVAFADIVLSIFDQYCPAEIEACPIVPLIPKYNMLFSIRMGFQSLYEYCSLKNDEFIKYVKPMILEKIWLFDQQISMRKLLKPKYTIADIFDKFTSLEENIKNARTHLQCELNAMINSHIEDILQTIYYWYAVQPDNRNIQVSPEDIYRMFIIIECNMNYLTDYVVFCLQNILPCYVPHLFVLRSSLQILIDVFCMKDMYMDRQIIKLDESIGRLRERYGDNCYFVNLNGMPAEHDWWFPMQKSINNNI